MAERIHVWVQRFKDRSTLQLQWHDPVTRKRKSKSAKTADPKAAEKARADLEYELNHGLHREPSRMAWEDFVEVYMEEKMAENRAQTQEKAEAVLRRFAEITRPRNLASITERSVSRYVATIRQEGYKPATIAGHLAYLRAAFRWAAKQRLLSEAPAITMPKVPKKKGIRVVTAEEFERLMDKAPDWQWRAFIATAWYTGMRRNEILNLTWDGHDRPWIDFRSKRIWLPGSFCKSGDDSWIPLHPQLEEILKESPIQNGRVFRFPYCEGYVSKLFKNIAAKAGLKITPQNMRQSFSSRYAAVVSAPILQRLMRHSSITTTLQFYTDVEDKLADAILKA